MSVCTSAGEFETGCLCLQCTFSLRCFFFCGPCIVSFFLLYFLFPPLCCRAAGSGGGDETSSESSSTSIIVVVVVVVVLLICCIAGFVAALRWPKKSKTATNTLYGNTSDGALQMRLRPLLSSPRPPFLFAC